MRTGSHSADVAIAGGGIAGIAAAIEALDRGRRVVIFDRDLEENFGGQARDAFGGLWFAGTPLQRRRGIRDGVELGYADWLSFGELGPEEAPGVRFGELFVDGRDGGRGFGEKHDLRRA